MISYRLVHKRTVELHTQQLDELQKTIADAATFIQEIEKGNLHAVYPDSTSQNVLREALQKMQQQLIRLSQQEQNQNFINTGLAQFGELTKIQYTSVSHFADAVLLFIIQYLKFNQGGLFVTESDEHNQACLQLKASYAYNRKKYLDKKIRPGQGLLGQAFLEKEKIVLTEIPDSYLQITSGLGEATPDFILVMPLLHNLEVEGMIELASFRKLEEYEILLIEQISESIGTVLATLKTKEQTDKLLNEMQEQAESLRAQEEEMRQNLEELQATQEKSDLMEQQLRLQKNDLEKTLKEHESQNEQTKKYLEDYQHVLVEILDELPQKIFLKDDKGRFILLNTAVANAHQKNIQQLLGTSDFDLFSKEKATEFRTLEEKIINDGKPVVYIHDEVVNGKTKILKTLKKPFYIKHLDQSGGLLGIQTDITEIKSLEAQLQEKERELQQLKKMLDM